MSDLLAPPRSSRSSAPRRAPGSVRRTSSIDVDWPEGRHGIMRLAGRARDVWTGADGGLVVLAEDGYLATVGPDRKIATIAADPPREALAGLVGRRAGGGLRRALDEAMGDERRRATPLYLILDDLPGASLVAGAAWPQWDKDQGLPPHSDAVMQGFLDVMVDACLAHAGEASGNTLEGVKRDYGDAPAADLARPDDPDGWHRFTTPPGAGLRRARRIDVRLDEMIVIDAEFQDSVARPAGGRASVHEYGLHVTADPVSHRLLSLAAEPRVLPYPECPSAAARATKLLGVPLEDLREVVLAEFAGAAGCTHLNDVLRALAEVPALLAAGQRREPA
jgi:hypothetical protein